MKRDCIFCGAKRETIKQQIEGYPDLGFEYAPEKCGACGRFIWGEYRPLEKEDEGLAIEKNKKKIVSSGKKRGRSRKIK